MLNVAAIQGRLVKDPEQKTTQSGTSVCSFTLAVERNFAKQGEERQTDWIDCVAWRGTAEFICRYFTKGQQMAVDGALQTRTWEDKNGSKHKAVEVVVSHVSFSGPREKKPDREEAPTQSGGFSDDDFEELAGPDDLPF